MFAALLLTVAIAAPPSAPSVVAERFVQHLSTENLDGIRELTAPGALAATDWKVLVEKLETYSCVSVNRATIGVTSDESATATVTVTLDATASWRGRHDRRAEFPREWRLELQRGTDGWRLRSAVTRERLIARVLVADESLTPAAIPRAAGDAPLPDVLLELLEEAVAVPHAARVRAVIDAATEAARSNGLPHVAARAVVARGRVDVAHGRFDVAEKLAREALELAERLGDHDLAAAAGLLSGTSAWLRGDRAAALERYAATAATVGIADDPRPGLKARYMSSLLLVRAGEVGRGLAEAARVSELAAEYGWNEGRCTSGMLRFEGYRILREHAAARKHALESLACTRRLGNERLVTMAMSNLAAAERAVGNGETARRLSEEIVARTTTTQWAERSVARLHLALMMTEQRRYAEAERTLLTAAKESRICREKGIEASVLAAMARVRLLAGRTGPALSAARDANALILQQKGAVAVGTYTTEPWAVRSTFGVALVAAGRPAEAMDVLQSAVELIETQRSLLTTDELGLSGFLADKDEAYRALVGLLVAAGRVEEAVTLSERLRARALGDAAARGHIDLTAGLSAADRARLGELNGALAAANREWLAPAANTDRAKLAARLETLRDELRAFRSELYVKNPRLRARSIEGSEDLLADASRLLPESGEAILTYVVNERETIGFLLHRRGERLEITARRIAVTRGDLERRVESLTAALAQRDLRYGRSAAALHRLLVAPFERNLAGKGRLYVVPEGVLWRVPFHALIGADGYAVVERMAVAFSPSLALLRAPRPDPRRAAGRGVLALGDAILPARTAAGAVLPRIPETRTEAAAIARLYGEDGHVLTGANATESALKAEARRFRVIHVATHSVINDAAPLYSSIALTPSSSDDGLLEAREMLDLELGAALVVLSSCGSAGGALTPGEGVVGMSWALMVAGSENAIVTLVDVGSGSTGRFMIDLHRRIARSDDYAGSLRDTQLAMMRRPETRHPFYWAPFVLIATRLRQAPTAAW